MCDRALRTALAGMNASNADEACAVLAGDALDDMAMATNRCDKRLHHYAIWQLHHEEYWSVESPEAC